MKKLFLPLALLGFVFTACQGGLDDEDNGGSVPKIEFAQQTIEVEFEPAEYEVAVTSPCSWGAIAKNDWIEVKTESGIAGTKTLKFSVTRNEEEDIREGTIVVKNEDYNLVAELYVTQKAFTPEWTVEPESLNFAVEGGTQEIAITANFEYEYKYTSNVDWLTIEKSENAIKVTAKVNTSFEERTAEIAISNEKYSITKTIDIVQEACEPKIELSQQNIKVGYEAAEYEVTITSYSWEATTKSSWIEIKTPSGITGTSVLKFSVNRNEESENREGTIVIKNTDYNLVAELYVTQMFQIISLGPSTSNLICENTDGSCELIIISNVEYTATIVSGYEWLCFANTSALTYTGNGNGTLVFNHRANNNNKRVARLVLKAKNRVVEVKIKQKGVFEDCLEIHPDDIESFGFTNGTDGYCLDIPKEGGEYAIRLRTTCLDNQISCWCNNSDAVVDFNVMNSVLYFSVKENLDGQPRILHIELSYIDGWDDKVTYKFSIRQNFNSHN